MDETNTKQKFSALYADLYETNYVVAQYHFTQFFAEHLVDVCRVFEADLQSVVVLALVGQSELSARIRSNFHDGGEMPTGVLVGRGPGVNTSSLAELSGIPRETVRRKLEGLARRGWIERDDRGLWRISHRGGELAPARRELLDLDRRAMERLARFLGTMHAIVSVRKVKPAPKETPRALDPVAGPRAEPD